MSGSEYVEKKSSSVPSQTHSSLPPQRSYQPEPIEQETVTIEDQLDRASKFGYNALDVPVNAPATPPPPVQRQSAIENQQQPQVEQGVDATSETVEETVEPEEISEQEASQTEESPKTGEDVPQTVQLQAESGEQQQQKPFLQAQLERASQFGYNGLDVPVNTPSTPSPRVQRKLTLDGLDNEYQPEVIERANPVLNGLNQFKVQRQEDSLKTEPQEQPVARTGEQPPVSKADLSIQRDDTETLPQVPSYQLTPPSLLQPPDPASRYGFGQNFQLHLDPQIQAMAMQQVQQQINPATILPALSQINLAQLTGLAPTATSAPNPFAAPTLPPASPLVPRGAGPSQPRAAGAGDLMKAILAVPAIKTAIKDLETQVMRDGDRLSTGEQVGVFSSLAVIGGGALAGVLSDPNARQLALSQLNGLVLPVPRLNWFHLEMNTSGDNLMVGLHVDVGKLLPPILGFGQLKSSPTAIGSPPISSSASGAIQRKCSECEAELADKEEKQPVQAKLELGEPGDKYEQEADDVARDVGEQTGESQIQRQPHPAPAPGVFPPSPPPPIGQDLVKELQTLIDGATWKEIRKRVYPKESAPGIQRAKERKAGKLPDLTGLGRIKTLDHFAQEVRGIQQNWNKWSSDERVKKLGEAANNELKDAEVPGFLVVDKVETEFKGFFLPSDWKFSISKALVSGNSLSNDNAAEVTNTTLHEGRHAEQHFLAARFSAGVKKKTAAEISTEQGIPNIIADKAVKKKFNAKTDPTVAALGKQMYQATVTESAKNQAISDDDGLVELAQKRGDAQTALNNLKTAATPENIAAATACRDALRQQITVVEQKYTLYRNIPYEADAHEVGDAAEQAFRGWQ